MTQPVEITFVETATDKLAGHEGRVALILGPGGRLPAGLPRPAREAALRALASKQGKAMKPGGVLELAFPAAMKAEALQLIWLPPSSTAQDARRAGAAIGARLGKVHTLVLAGGHRRAQDVALGLALRGYDFSAYQTGAGESDDPAPDTATDTPAEPPQAVSRQGAADDARLTDAQTGADAAGDASLRVGESARVTFMVRDPEAQAKLATHAAAVAEGVFFTRDLINEPANVLTTSDFADRLKAMEEIGLTVEVLDEDELQKLGMRALLAVGQGSETPSKVVVMRWNGGGDEAPLALVGKGVVFDTGGISIKPAAGMEEMTMDMGGAGVVAGVMRTLALRRAKANVVGLVGLVENMPDGRAQRPGDIVKSMKGDTIEVINTDAEGRLVLADVLWYAQTRFQPAAVIDLATLTGAVIIALGHDNAGVFCNDDALAGQILSAARAEGEGAWRLPLAPAYDKLIKSRLADMKNTGGRPAGSITAAQFLQRFVRKGQPWAHIDIAGVALPPSATDLAPKGATGWGVMTLDRLVRDRFEAK
ncbi:leucyl aminopeptidase [Paracoccus alcaliphilus]|uniref:Probable cytosol aminopeptidase n=1 Tax=Paracoccus alcaliphilus TaxID=34002 RepID=A0A1H8L3J6_9RHOB|nr:leucyl aminopeptidase [Paracoccus alcaliphilus]WCR18083.1 leucyl aminopeptidase [Paracoccus alcaliphilus]SEN99697.1 leucyl aminopeptidase [Paracoccus alcaliphilus]